MFEELRVYFQPRVFSLCLSFLSNYQQIALSEVAIAKRHDIVVVASKGDTAQRSKNPVNSCDEHCHLAKHYSNQTSLKSKKMSSEQSKERNLPKDNPEALSVAGQVLYHKPSVSGLAKRRVIKIAATCG